jgi:DNA-binding NarL/FixJ family response regulator
MGTTPTTTTHTAYVVEDDELTRHSIVEKLRASALVTVPVAVGTCAQILAALALARPDVLLVDLGLPDGSGLNVIRNASQRWPRMLVMVITAFGDEKSVIAAIRAGATGYLLKDDTVQSITASVRQLIAGGSPMSPAVTRHLVRHIRPGATNGGCEPTVHLSKRELQVLELAHKGFAYGEIATLMRVSPSTVAGYTRRIYEKLAVNSRSEAVFEASRLGIFDDRREP